MPRLDRLPQVNRNSILMLPVQVHDTTPFTRPARPLAACRLAIVTTAGLHRRGDRPFGPADQTYRAIPADTPAADIVQSHTSIGFDRVPIIRDLNISFPLDRVRELVGRSELGGLGPHHYSFMGYQGGGPGGPDTSEWETHYVPEVVGHMLGEGVEAVVITPT